MRDCVRTLETPGYVHAAYALILQEMRLDTSQRPSTTCSVLLPAFAIFVFYRARWPPVLSDDFPAYLHCSETLLSPPTTSSTATLLARYRRQLSLRFRGRY